MGQHPNPSPNPNKDEDDLEELGTPFYQGNGLTVRALSTDELQRSSTPTPTSRPSG
jgi:hypothetical protein